MDLANAAGVAESTVSRFERGEGWRQDIDTIVAAYERELGLQRHELWRRAIERARKS